jgi:hypothetical protein
MVVSTINTTVKDKERIKEHVNGSSHIKSSITKHHSDVLHETEKLLNIRIEDQNQTLILMLSLTRSKNMRSLYAYLKEKKGETEASFVASHAAGNAN